MQEHLQKRLGIFGGTFNPIHHGHLIIAETVREALCLDRVLFVPVGVPPHKTGADIADAEHRFRMVECAVSSNPCFEASRLEIERKGFTYTIDTLTALQRVYGCEAALFFIIGADVVPELTTWKEHKIVFGLCEFAAVFRPGMEKMAFLQQIEQLEKTQGVRIHPVDAPTIDISSTDIRERRKAGKSIRYLVPSCVEDYMIKYELYGSGAR